jgi:hypothetical protein
LSKNMHPRVDDEGTLPVRILREAHFFQSFAWKRDLAIRRRALGSIFADESQRAVGNELDLFAADTTHVNTNIAMALRPNILIVGRLLASLFG